MSNIEMYGVTADGVIEKGCVAIKKNFIKNSPLLEMLASPKKVFVDEVED